MLVTEMLRRAHLIGLDKYHVIFGSIVITLLNRLSVQYPLPIFLAKGVYRLHYKRPRKRSGPVYRSYWGAEQRIDPFARTLDTQAINACAKGSSLARLRPSGKSLAHNYMQGRLIKVAGSQLTKDTFLYCEKLNSYEHLLTLWGKWPHAVPRFAAYDYIAWLCKD